MNKYPAWKYAIIVLAVVVSMLYAAPNLFGEVPAVQIAPQRASAKIDEALRKNVEDALKSASVGFIDDDMQETALRIRFADTDAQLKGRDVIQAAAGPGYVVALNLMPNSPHWLQSLGAKPM